MNPEITVVIPYHNEKKTIEYTLLRVAEQTLPPTVAIFVNSSSTDNTSEIVDNWIIKNQSRFKTQFKNIFEHTDNPASSKNVGIRHAQSEWIAFMDCGQNFEKYWLESQHQFAIKNNLEIVSGVVFLIGENWIDRCAVAQTYGYKTNRPCLPTTLVKKSVFLKTGLLLEGRRAGYDAAWPLKLKKLGIKRGINEKIIIRYIGVNFSANLKHLFKKSILYAKPTVKIEGYWPPYLYLTGPFIFIISLLVSPLLTLGLMISYVFLRAFFIPLLKSKNLFIFQEHPTESLGGLLIVGMVIDLGKFIGIIEGVHYYYFSKFKSKT